MTLAERFFARFAGLDRVHGSYNIKADAKANEKGKLVGTAFTVLAPPTTILWEQHLDGVSGLGIVPIRDDSTSVFGAIDIDVYKGLDIKALSKELIKLQLPLILCRSKSGGPQLYTFTSEPVPATLIRGKLMEWAIALGHSGVEVFPKQVRLAGQNDQGNWINMPYFDSEKTERYAIYDGKKLSAEKFLDLADLMALDEETLKEVKIANDPQQDELWSDAPPCLQALARNNGFGEGSRNNALFNIGVYLRKRHGDAFEEFLDSYNQKFLNPPLGHKEVAQVLRSIKRKAYEYTCKEPPIAPVCNRQICLTRKFGIGTSDGDPGVVFGGMIKVKTEPPTWIWDVNGARLELSTQEIKDQSRFHSRCIDELNIWPNAIKARQWQELVRDKLQTVETVEVPEDATPEGQMMYYLQAYCTSKARAKLRDELTLNKPWVNPEDNRVYFSAAAFSAYLETHRIKTSPKQLWNWLRNRGADSVKINVDGRFMNLWTFPAFPEPSQDLRVPTIDDLEEI